MARIQTFDGAATEVLIEHCKSQPQQL